MHAEPKLLQVCERVKITCSQVQTVGRMGKKSPPKCYTQTVFTFWTTLMYKGPCAQLIMHYPLRMYWGVEV
jgi:hypothetical protein